MHVKYTHVCISLIITASYSAVVLNLNKKKLKLSYVINTILIVYNYFYNQTLPLKYILFSLFHDFR